MGFGVEFLESHYTTETTLSQKQGSLVRLVRSAAGERFVRREYDRDWRALFARLKSLDLEEIPPIVHILFDGEKTVIIEKFIDGTPLSDCIHEQKLPDNLHFSSIAEKILITLQKLHKAGIIHRDLKPEHIFLTAGGVCLIDFGIARLHAPDADRDTEIRGTRRYAPPEQFGVMQTDPRADLYALSRTLEEVLPLATENPLAKKLFRAWLAKGAAFDPNARYASADEMRAELLRQKRTGNFLIPAAALLLGTLLFLPLRPLLFPAPETPPPTEDTETAPSPTAPAATPQTENSKPAQEEQNEISHTQAPPEPEPTKEPAAAQSTGQTKTPAAQTEPPPAAPETAAAASTPPITAKPQGGIPSLVLADGESDTSTVKLAANASAAIRAENRNGTLSLVLSDNAGHSAEYAFSYQKPPRDYPNADRIDAEIHLLDMNGDGVLDIVPVLARRQHKGSLALIDGASCWCVTCSPADGFARAEGAADSNAFRVYPDGVMDNNMFVYYAANGKLQAREW